MTTIASHVTLSAGWYAIGDPCHLGDAPIAARFRVCGGDCWLLDEDGNNAIGIDTAAVAIAPIPYTPNPSPEIDRMMNRRLGRVLYFSRPAEVFAEGSNLWLGEICLTNPYDEGFELLSDTEVG